MKKSLLTSLGRAINHSAADRSNLLREHLLGEAVDESANYRISEGETQGRPHSDFKIQRKLKYLITWSMSAPLQKYELSSMKWASNGELSTHDIHKLLSKMSQSQAFERQVRCLEPTESQK